MEIKTAESINKKALLLSETETLRNERDMALGKIAQRDAVIEKLKLELKHAKEDALHKSMSLHDTARKTVVKRQAKSSYNEDEAGCCVCNKSE